MTREVLTVTIRGNRTVLAKRTKYGPSALTYANRTQAERTAAKMGPDWAVTHGASGWGGVFYVGYFPKGGDA